MEEKTSKTPDVIDIVQITKKIWARKKLFAKTLPITFVISCIFIFGFPRYYTTDVKLAPELGINSSVSTLSSIASSFGFDIGDLKTNDAITPLLYPDLMEDNGFVSSLFDIKVQTKDGTIKTTYYDYMKKHQKSSIWIKPFIWIKDLFIEKPTKRDITYDPYLLPKDEEDVFKACRSNIKISFNKKTSLIAIDVTAQDPLVSKIMADSIQSRLQHVITAYRTNKARIDYEYYKKLAEEAKHDYERTRQRYGSFADGNVNITMQSVRLKAEEMESEMELRFNTYSTLNAQMQAAKAKVQEHTPAFTIIKGAAIPNKPSGPKRMIFVFACLLAAFVVTCIYCLVKDTPSTVES